MISEADLFTNQSVTIIINNNDDFFLFPRWKIKCRFAYHVYAVSKH